MQRSRKRQWNIAFLVRDYPPEMGTVGPIHFNGRIGDDFLAPLRQLGQKEPSILSFLAQDPAKRFLWFGFRVDAASKLDALAEARHRMDGLIDGASFFRDNDLPRISGFAWVGTAREEDLHLVRHNQQLWIEMANGSDESRAKWKKRNEELQAKITRFFSLAIEMHSRSKTPLSKQLRHSMRMFRHGKQSGSWGVEYICKFCALEGLVCGEEQYKKEEKLKTRLTALFRDDGKEFLNRVKRLWDFRSNAVHTAKAFDAGSLTEGVPLGVHIEMIEHLYVGALVFALEKVPTVQTVQELWDGVKGYTLPDFARMQRPRDFPRYAVPNMESPIGVSMPGGGRLFRRHLAMGRSSYEAANTKAPTANGSTQGAGS